MREFNIVVIGVGGQGIITSMQVIAQAALNQGYDVKTSELHGLAQRGGSVPCHIRFGKKVYSPLVMEGEAHLIIALEPMEALRACYFASKENGTKFLINTYRITPLSIPILKLNYPKIEEINDTVRKFASKVIAFNASRIVKIETNSIIPTNVFMLGFAVAKNMIPLKKECFVQSIDQMIPKRFLELNHRVFELGYKAGLP